VKSFCQILILSIAISTLHAQDTTKIPLMTDTTKIAQKTVEDTTKAQIDSVVTYSATDSVVYSIDNRQMLLYKNGDMKYKDFKLNAGQIDINWDTSILTAQGRKDSADKTVEQPVFNDGGEVYNSSHVTYDFKTQKGRVNVANTEIDKSYYHGELIKKFGKDVLFIENGRFTTCDNTADPDYWFQSSKMKLVVNDRIVAEPIIFYLDGVPVFALPFGVFPSKGGRRSGIITPAFGESANAGRYLSHFGYFWAINDYSDLTTTADWYTRGGYALRSGFRYNVRYYLNGSLYGAYDYRYTGQPGDVPTSSEPQGYSLQKDWDLQFTHDQVIDPTTRIVANVNMSSGSYYRNTSLDYGQNLLQNLVSDASFFKTWENSGNSLSLNIHRDQNLGNGSISATLPSMSFSHSTSYPFRRSDQSSDLSDNLSWYEMIGYSYSGEFENQTSKTWDTTVAGDYRRFSAYGASHSVIINASPKAGFFTITPSLSITDKMYTSRTIYDEQRSGFGHPYQLGDTVVGRTEYGLYNVGTFSTGVSASTRLFGIMQPNIFGITAFRHTLEPSIAFSYQPDFSKPYWHYYQTFVINGVSQQYNNYQTAVYGGAPSGTVAAASFSLANIFEMKTLSSDTSQAENKIQLLNLDLSTSYNFAADSMKLAPLSTSFRTNIAQKFDFSGNANFDFYKFDTASTVRARINKYLWSEGKLPDMTSFSLSLSTSLQGQSKKSASSHQSQSPDSLAQQQDSLKALQQYNGFYQQVESPDLSIPWNLSFGIVYTRDKPEPDVLQQRASLSLNLGFNLTDNWNIKFSGGYDILNHQIVVPTVHVYRDLHCWEMNLTWNPIGAYRGFNLEIRIKASQLQDIKVTKREDTLVGD